jgi:hypothetical protein
MKKYKGYLFLFLGILICLGQLYYYYSVRQVDTIRVDTNTLVTSSSSSSTNVIGVSSPSIKPPKISCKHGHYKRLYSRDDPNHPRNKGYFSLADLTGTSIKEGYATYDYNPTNLVTPFVNGLPVKDSTFADAANPASTLNYNNAVNNQNEVNYDQCSKYCDHPSCCGTLAQAQQTTNVVNIDFSANPVPGGLYQLFCSNYGGVTYGETILSVNQYNDNTMGNYNDCMYNQDQLVQEICGIAQNNLNQYQTNLGNPYTVSNLQNEITNAVGSGTITGASQNWNQSHYQITDILNAMQSSWTTCNNANNNILANAINNCSNPNTSITNVTSGPTPCDLDNYKKIAINQTNFALAATQNSLVNDTTNTAILNANNVFNNNPTATTPNNLTNMITQLSQNALFGDEVYNYCSNPQTTRLDPSGVILCLSPQYNDAYNTCQAAMNDAISEGDVSGNAVIAQRWADVSNNLTYASYNGNTNNNVMANVQSLLQTTRQFCEQKVQMYNAWRTDEDIAAALPCVPEAPIFSQNTTALQGQVQTWVDATITSLNTLYDQLLQIEADLSGVPQNNGTSQTILQLTPSNIQTAPYGALPIFTISGPPLSQTMNIVIPSGSPGPSGLAGTMPGPNGNKGNMGIPGPQGTPGIWEIPVEYTNTFA